MLYSASVRNKHGGAIASIASSNQPTVIDWMSKQKKVRKMKDMRPRLFRKSHDPIYVNKACDTMTCNFLILKRI